MSAKIESLTPEQEAQLEVYYEKWLAIGLSTTRMDKKVAKKAVNEVYKVAGLAPPKNYYFADSPLAALEQIRVLKGEDTLTTDTPHYGAHDAGWLSFYNYFLEVVGLEECRELEPMMVLAQQCGWFWLYENAVIFSEKPTKYAFNESNDLHNEHGPAIEYADGVKYYFLNGVAMPEWLFETPKEEIDPKKVLGIQNVEIRSEAIRFYGMDRLYKLLDVKVIDTRQDGYELLSIDVGADVPWPYLKMINPSTAEIHIEAVGEEAKTVTEALASRYPDRLLKKYGYNEAIARA